jgi:hypothetical protein
MTLRDAVSKEMVNGSVINDVFDEQDVLPLAEE